MYRRLLHISQHLPRRTPPPAAFNKNTIFRKMTSSSSSPAITLYTFETPNGIKISIALEELGLPYKFETVDISKGVQKEPWFLDINPNGRIPAIKDTSFGDGKEISVFESGAILQYLVETYDKDHKLSYPKGTREYWETQQWLFFQNAGVGPMQGQANHFFRYAPEKIPYAIDRYIKETERLFGILDKRLASQPSGFLVGDRLTIADISTWGWVRLAPWSGVDLKQFPALEKWKDTIAERPAVQKGVNVPREDSFKKLLNDPKAQEEAVAEAAKWIVPK